MTKAIECHYPTRASSNTGSKVSTSAGIAISAQNISAALVTDPSDKDNRHEARNDRGALPQGEIGLSNPEWDDFGGVSLDWDEQDFGFVDLLDPGRTVAYSVLGTVSLGSDLTPSMDQESQRPQGSLPPRVSIPTRPTDTVRSLILRPRLQAGAQRITGLILHVLKSYPLMMLRHDTLPPFIHPQSVSHDFENSNIESLDDCISLVGMISRRGHGSRKLFWINVRLQCERFLADVGLPILKSIPKHSGTLDVD